MLQAAINDDVYYITVVKTNDNIQVIIKENDQNLMLFMRKMCYKENEPLLLFPKLMPIKKCLKVLEPQSLDITLAISQTPLVWRWHENTSNPISFREMVRNLIPT